MNNRFIAGLLIGVFLWSGNVIGGDNKSNLYRYKNPLMPEQDGIVFVKNDTGEIAVYIEDLAVPVEKCKAGEKYICIKRSEFFYFSFSVPKNIDEVQSWKYDGYLYNLIDRNFEWKFEEDSEYFFLIRRKSAVRDSQNEARFLYSKSRGLVAFGDFYVEEPLKIQSLAILEGRYGILPWDLNKKDNCVIGDRPRKYR